MCYVSFELDISITSDFSGCSKDVSYLCNFLHISVTCVTSRTTDLNNNIERSSASTYKL